MCPARRPGAMQLEGVTTPAPLPVRPMGAMPPVVGVIGPHGGHLEWFSQSLLAVAYRSVG